MALIENTLFGERNKVDIAIQRIKNYDPLALGIYDEPYYVAYSGGKDSDVIRILCELAGVKYDLVHHLTTVDAPETVYYVRSIGAEIPKPETNMWKLIAEKGFPPLRIKRYCCSELKENGGVGRLVMTGVRWAESANRRSKRGAVEVQPRDPKKSLILNADNDESRRQFETCGLKGKRVVNPIIDWGDEDVWEFLRHHGCESNPLYQEGWKRIGCIGCPMSGTKGMIRDFARWPKYYNRYLRAFQKIIDAGRFSSIGSAEALMHWWIHKGQKDDQICGQEVMAL